MNVVNLPNKEVSLSYSPIDSSSILPFDMIKLIFTYLSSDCAMNDIGKCFLINKQWNNITFGLVNSHLFKWVSKFPSDMLFIENFKTALNLVKKAVDLKQDDCYVGGDSRVIKMLQQRAFNAETCWVKAVLFLDNDYDDGDGPIKRILKVEAAYVSLDKNYYQSTLQYLWNRTVYHKTIYKRMDYKDYPKEFNLFYELNLKK